MTTPQSSLSDTRLRRTEAAVESFFDSAIDRIREATDDPLRHPLGSHPELIAALVEAAATVYLAEALCESIDSLGNAVASAGSTVGEHLDKHGSNVWQAGAMVAAQIQEHGAQWRP